MQNIDDFFFILRCACWLAVCTAGLHFNCRLFLPTMFDVVREKPQPVEKDGKPLIGPVEAHGVKLLSIGFFADPDQAIVWRGPMASKAPGQLFTDGDWGDLD